MLASPVPSGILQKWSSMIGIPHMIYRNVTERIESTDRFRFQGSQGHSVWMCEYVWQLSGSLCCQKTGSSAVQSYTGKSNLACNWEWIRYWCLIGISLPQSVNCMLCLLLLVGYILGSVSADKGVCPSWEDLYIRTVTSSGSFGYCASRLHFSRTIDPPLCPLSPSLSLLRPSFHPTPFVSPSLWVFLGWFITPLCLSLHRTSCVRMCLCVSARLFACTPVISLRVCMSAPEIPAPPRWAWSHGPARRIRQPLKTHTARTSRPPRTRSRSSTLTNSAWTHFGVRWRPSNKGAATRTSTAPGEIQGSPKVNRLQILWRLNRNRPKALV